MREAHPHLSWTKTPFLEIISFSSVLLVSSDRSTYPTISPSGSQTTRYSFTAAVHFPDPSMAEVEAPKLSSLAEHYLVENKEPKPEAAPKSTEVVEPSSGATSVEIVEKIEESSPAVVSDEVTAAPAEEEDSKESGPADETTKDNDDQESSDNVAESGTSDEQETEETTEIKLETAPADFRFPTTNQTRHCFTRYIEYHRCVAAKGEGAPDCDKFAKYYRALCPGEWIDRWNEQRENGTFPGPL